MFRRAGAIGALLALLVVGCGGDSDSANTISYRPFSIPVGKNWPEGKVPGRWPNEFKPSENGLVGSEPKPIIPDRPPPEFLVAVELLDGADTPPSFPGDRLTIQYVVADYDSKKKLASSWDEGKPLSFTLGSGELSEGLEEGLEGFEFADRRELVIPPELMTGGSLMKDLPEDSTLVFVIELLKIEKGSGL